MNIVTHLLCVGIGFGIVYYLNLDLLTKDLSTVRRILCEFLPRLCSLWVVDGKLSICLSDRLKLIGEHGLPHADLVLRLRANSMASEDRNQDIGDRCSIGDTGLLDHFAVRIFG